MSEQPLYQRLIARSSREWRHEAIEASAGTGKTWTIEHLVLELLKLPPDRLPGTPARRLSLSRILIVTFTEKAAGELKDRIREKLRAEISSLKSSQTISDLISHLEENLNRFDEASIYTIHGFCKNYLDGYAFEGKRPMHSELEDEGLILDRVLRDYLDSPNFRKYDKIDLALVLHKKVECFFSVLKSALQHTADNAEIVFPEWESDFDNLSAHTVRELALESLRQIPKNSMIWMSQCLDANEIILPKRALKLSPHVADIFRALSSDQPAESRLNRLISDLEGHPDHLNVSKTLQKDPLWQDLQPCLRNAWTYKVLRRKEIWTQILADVRQALRDYKVSRSLQTFNDMIRDMREELNHDHSPLLNTLRQKFTFALIDEFQDTSQDQWLIFKRLFIDDNPLPLRRVLWLIGDRKQSIYRFQGADVETCIQAMDTLSPKNRNTLNVNYRSCPILIQCYNQMFSHPQWFAQNYLAVRSGKTDEPGNRELSHLLRKWDRDYRHFICDMQNVKSKKKRFMQNWTVRLIVDLIRKHGIPPSSIAVLFEKNSEIYPVLKMLRSHGIPASINGEIGLFSSEECLQVIHLLQAIQEPANASLIRQAALEIFFAYSIPDLLSNRAENIFFDVQSKLLDWKSLWDQNRYESLFSHLLKDTDTDIRLKKQSGNKNRSLSAIRQIFSYCLKLARGQSLDLNQIIRKLSNLYLGKEVEKEEENTFHRESDLSAVRLMTIHKSKGLEFDIVFLCTGSGERSREHRATRVRIGHQMFVAIPPFSAAISEKIFAQEIEERKRLWYVALTRAKWIQFIPFWNSTRSGNTASAFLDQVLADILAENPPHWTTTTPIPDSSDLPAPREISAPAPPPAEALSYEEITRARISERRRILTSFSALSRQYSDEEKTALLPGATDPLSLPPGPQTGTALHAILERISFQLVAETASPHDLFQNPVAYSQIREILDHSDLLDVHDQSRIFHATEIIWNSLHTPLTDPMSGEEFKIIDIPENDRQSEVEYFWYYAPQTTRIPSMIYGFMDLIFRRGDRYYILDWKTNRLPDYSPESLQKCMTDHHYILQACIYVSALRRYLRRKNFSQTEIGGVFYVFLRGTHPEKRTGVWSASPAFIKDYENTVLLPMLNHPYIQ